MTELFDMDVAWRRSTEARERGDIAAEALALTALGQALHEAGRLREGNHIHEQADDIAPSTDVRLARAELLMKRGIKLEELGGDKASWSELSSVSWERRSPEVRQRGAALSAGSEAFRRAGEIFRQIGERQRYEAAIRRSNEVSLRPMPIWIVQDMGGLQALESLEEPWASAEPSSPHEEAGPSADQVSSMSSPRTGEVDSQQDHGGACAAPPITYVELAAGFLAVKLLGPFLETFASKLGERFGESTGQVLGRIRVIRRRNRASAELEIDDPATHAPTVLVLPADFSEEARLAVIELDITAEKVRGATMHWNPDTGAWEPTEDDQS
ncbi:hypothetical protein ACFV0L_18505 [Streptosporangium canum]|uniref:hypothetical protein n=1 Tax=Streptosporangium canum TaxID=324952 RepID=UPI003676A502